MDAKEIVAKEVARQAEFGMEPSWEDFVIAGIREVVEIANPTIDRLARGRVVPEWQAKLKEWR